MVVLHWLTVLLLVGAGLLFDGEGVGSSPINIHMVLGAVLLLVMVIRLVLRLTVRRPAWAGTGNEFFNRIGELVHVGLYFSAFLILTFGGLIAVQRNLIGYVMGIGSAVQGGLDSFTVPFISSDGLRLSACCACMWARRYITNLSTRTIYSNACGSQVN